MCALSRIFKEKTTKKNFKNTQNTQNAMKKKVKLPQSKIEQIFEKSTNPTEVLIFLYRFAIPEWDKVKTIGSYPRLARKTAEFILETMQTKFPNEYAGLLWLQKGFGNSAEVAEWTIDNSNVKLTY